MPNPDYEKGLVSVIIPAYNATRWIARTIDSVRAQTYQPVEIIVVDDGSTDGTDEYVKNSFPQVTILRKPNGGPATARNFGAKAAHGEFLAFLDMDDLWAPTKLAAQLTAVEGIPDWGLCVTRSIKFLAHDEYPIFERVWVRPGTTRICFRTLLNDRWSFFRKNHITTCSTALVKREVFDEIGGFDENINLLGVDDYDFYLRISHDWQVIMVKAPLVGYQITPGSISRDKLALQVNARVALAKWAHVSPEVVPKIIQRRNNGIIRKLLRAGREQEAYALFSNPVFGREKPAWAFHLLALGCRIHALTRRADS